jgi:hypothetical protein
MQAGWDGHFSEGICLSNYHRSSSNDYLCKLMWDTVGLLSMTVTVNTCSVILLVSESHTVKCSIYCGSTVVVPGCWLGLAECVLSGRRSER